MRLALVSILLAVLLVGCGSASERTGETSPRTCQGAAALCERRLDEVVFAATHNSYAAADQPGWYFASQRYGIARQLEDGVRALLLDVHFGVPDPERGLVRTDLRAEGSDRNKVAQQIPREGLALADHLAGRIGTGRLEGTPGLYLCHTLCELGSEPLGPELRVIASFLDREPDQVLVLIVEDYVPAARIAGAFERAGLARQAVQLDRGRPLPRLGALIDADTRLVVFSEKQGGSPPWYLPAFSFIEDTPLGANRPDQLSCERFRGEPDSPLLLINHWIPPFPPIPRLNALIGRERFLRDRVEECMAVRRRPGAIVAVDFYERGSAVRVASELNAAAR